MGSGSSKPPPSTTNMETPSHLYHSNSNAEEPGQQNSPTDLSTTPRSHVHSGKTRSRPTFHRKRAVNSLVAHASYVLVAAVVFKSAQVPVLSDSARVEIIYYINVYVKGKHHFKVNEVNGFLEVFRSLQNAHEAWELLTYLPPYNERFEYSHTHFLYTNDLQKLEDIPPPHTAPTRKHEIFDPDSYKRVDDSTDAVKGQALDKHMSELVRLLIGDYDNDIAKVRALYRWFTSQPVEASDYKSAKPNTAMYHLGNLKNKRNTYAGFFSLLCWYADLPCAIIRGYLKGSTYEVGQKINKDLHRGEWNAVLIDGNWRLINSFWGACVLSGDEDDSTKENYCYTCDENFFLTDPQQLIYTHFPEEPVWQLLDSKKTIQEFETMVFLKDRFFNLEMRVLSHPLCNAEAKDGEIEILFGLHPQKSVNHSFLCIPSYFIENVKQSKTKPVELPQKNVQLDFIHRPNENVLSIKVRFPKVGTYKLEIVGKDNTVTALDYEFDWVAIYKVTVNSVPEKQMFFPILEAAGWGPGKILEEFGLIPLTHKNGVIKMLPGPLEMQFKIVDLDKFNNATIVFKLLPIGAEDGHVMGNHPFQKTGDILEAAFNVPEGEFKMKICHMFGEGHERNICNYHIISASPPAPKQSAIEQTRSSTPELDEEGELREKLHQAIDSQNLEELERAVDLVESKGFSAKLASELREARDLIARLKRLQKLIHEVMTLNQRTIAEIKSYTHPTTEIHIVMRGTLLLLGNPEEETKDWKNVQALIGKTGKMSLKRRIQEINVNQINESKVSRVKAMLKDIRLEDIVVISAGAATFYSWSIGIAEEVDTRLKAQAIKP